MRLARDAFGRPSSVLRFERRGPKTALVAAHAELPLLLQRPMHAPNGGAIVTLLTPAAALFNGDVIDLDVECAVGADVTLVTTGATRLNRGRAESHLSARVEAGAILRSVPGELIPFSGASYRQSIAIDLEPGASAVVLEVVTPGASFTYDRLDFETCVAVHGTTVVRERFIMTPASRNRLLGFTHYGSLLAIGPTFDAATADVAHTRLACAGVWGSASVVAGRYGVAVKALGRTAQTLRAALLGSLTPDLARGLHHELELAPHLVPREQVAEGG